MIGTCQMCDTPSRVIEPRVFRIGGTADDPEHDEFVVCVDRKRCERVARRKCHDAIDAATYTTEPEEVE